MPGAVVLDAMDPSAVQKAFEVAIAGSPCLPPHVATGRRSTDAIFYDPITSVDDGEPTRQGNSRATSGHPVPTGHQRKHGGRGDAMAAVARDLATLSMRKGR